MEAAVEESGLVSGLVVEKVRKPGTFESGADPRTKQNQAKARLEGVPAARVEVEAAIDPILTAYRHVLKNPKRFDGSGLEEDVRKLRAEDRKAFLSKYQELERLEREARSKAVEASSAKLAEKSVDLPVDVGEDRARELLGRLLAEYKRSE